MQVRYLGDLHRHSGRLGDAHDGEGSLDFANAVRRMAKLKELQDDPAQALALWHETRDSYAAVGMTPGVEEADDSIERLTR